MVLDHLEPTAQNTLSGRLGSQSRSQSDDEGDDDFSLPPAKRSKISVSREDNNTSVDDTKSEESLLLAKDELSGTEDKLEDEHPHQREKLRPTDLENALAPVEADAEAIAEYEYKRFSDRAQGQDSSQPGVDDAPRRKSSIYVEAFNLALDTVLADEEHLFDEAERELFQQWRDLSYEAQYLYVRLFLRKTSAWHRCEKIGYHSDLTDVATAIKDLLAIRRLSVPSDALDLFPGESDRPTDISLQQQFTFADDSDKEITTLEEASSLLNLEEVKTLAKEARVQGRNKGELLQALRRMSQKQSGLGWVGLKRSDSGQIIPSNEATTPDDSDKQAFNDFNRDRHFVSKILASTGPCIRLSMPVLKLFERVHLVFYRSTEWTEKSLTTVILATISRRNFPQYIVSRSSNIFTSRSILLEFEAALRTQFKVDNILEFNGTPKKEGLEEILRIFEEVYPRWKVILLEEQRKEERVYDSGEGAYLRRFSPAWVYTRIIHKAEQVLGKLHMYDREYQVLTELLDQHLFHTSRRGSWYQRKALLEEHYMALSTTVSPQFDTVDIQERKKRWKRISLKTCEMGLQDRDCHLIYHYDLQKRVRKLEKSLKLAKREQHDFGHVTLAKPFERTVYGIRVEREALPSNRPNERAMSTKTIWIDEKENGGECSVEEMCLSWYRSQSWKGYHSEGGIVRTLFAYLFFDILFIYIPNVFQTPYQTCPLDLHTDAFYPSRASEINHRLVEISNGEAARLIREVSDKERENKTCIVGLNWDFELEDLLEIASCFDGAALATVCKVMAQEYGQRGGGLPDLFLWNNEKKEVMFSEVKSENDRLSDTQRLWIHVLTSCGIKVELCNALAREVITRHT